MELEISYSRGNPISHWALGAEQSDGASSVGLANGRCTSLVTDRAHHVAGRYSVQGFWSAFESGWREESRKTVALSAAVTDADASSIKSSLQDSVADVISTAAGV